MAFSPSSTTSLRPPTRRRTRGAFDKSMSCQSIRPDERKAERSSSRLGDPLQFVAVAGLDIPNFYSPRQKLDEDLQLAFRKRSHHPVLRGEDRRASRNKTANMYAFEIAL